MESSSSPPRRLQTANASPSVSPPRSMTHLSKKSITRQPAFELSPSTPRRILIPTTRVWPPPNMPPRSFRPTAKLSKRHASVDFTHSPSLAAVAEERPWLNHLTKLSVQVLESGVELLGYQVFVVEQWLVDRTKAVRTVTVYTGNPKDRIFATILGATQNLPNTEAEDMFQRTLLEFRKDGARPKETERGVIMVTSLANFRSDLNIVHIPNGDVLAVKDDLYVNINLQRLGAGGRSGLNLDPFSTSSKEKFLQMYRIPEPSSFANQPSSSWFKDTVLELVRTVQSALTLFKMFSLATDERDGLICNSVMEGMQCWANTIGVNLRLEPTESVLDPPAVSALLGMVISIKNKLSVLAIPQLPKDPFIEPVALLHALPSLRKDGGAASSNPNGSDLHFIDWEFVVRLQNSYSKTRQTEPYKVHKVLKNKIEDLTTASTSLATNLNIGLRATSGSGAGSNHDGGASTSRPGRSLSIGSAQHARADTLLDFDITDIEALVRVVTSTTKSDIPGSLRDIWSGRPGHHRHLRETEESNRLNAMASLSARHPLGLGGSWDDNEDNSYAGFLWRGAGARVQRKGQALAHGIAGWTGIDAIGRKSKSTTDGVIESDTSAGQASSGKHPAFLPSVVITSDKSPAVSDHEDHISSPPSMYSAAPSYRSPTSSVTNLSDNDRGIRKFSGLAAPLDASMRAIGMIYPDSTTSAAVRARENSGSLLPGTGNARAASTSTDSIPLPETIGELAAAFEPPGPLNTGTRQRWRQQLGDTFKDDTLLPPAVVTSGDHSLRARDSRERTTERERRLAMRRSISNLQEYSELPVLEKQYLQIDVEIAYQLVLIREKQSNMINAIKVLEIMKTSLENATQQLSDSLAPQAASLPGIESQLNNLTLMTREGRTEVNTLKRRAETSRYQTDRLVEGTDRLEHMLETYRKRIEDVELAVEGLYTLEPYVSPDEKEGEEGEPVEQGHSAEDEDSFRASEGGQNPLIRWISSFIG